MKFLWLIGFVAIVIAVALSGCAEQEPDLESQSSTVDITVNGDNGDSVDIKGFAYDQATLTISKGTTVTWTQQDSTVHTVTSVSGNVLDSQNLAKGETFSYTFDETGTFEYYCTNHPSMKGTVIVT